MGSMSIDSDFEDLLSCFTTHGVRFLVVGGYAVGCHGLPRATKDLDVWVDPEAENARNAWSALAEFGMPLGDIRPADLARTIHEVSRLAAPRCVGRRLGLSR